MPDFDPFSAMVVDEPTALEMAKARAAALRGQNYAGLVMGLAHDPNAARIGGQLSQQAQTGLSDLGNMPGERLKMALGRQKYQQEGPQEALGGQTPNIYELLTKRKAAEAQAQYHQSMVAQNWVPFTNSDTGETFLVNHRTGQIRGMNGAPPPQAPLGPTPAPQPGPATPGAPTATPGQQPLPPSKPLGKFGNKLLAQLKTDLDPNASRAGVMKGNQERLNSAERLLTLATDPLTGGPADLTPQQMSEVSSAFASLIGGGSSGETTRREFTPYTKGRTMAELTQWLTDDPHGAGQQAFVKQLMESARRERDVAAGQLRQAQASRLSSNITALQRYPKESLEILQSYGFDPAEIDMASGRYTPKQKAKTEAQASVGSEKTRHFERRGGKLVEVTK